MSNPELQQLIIQTLQSSGEQRGGVRPNSGPKASGATHSAEVEKTNEKNRAKNREAPASAQVSGELAKGGVQ